MFEETSFATLILQFLHSCSTLAKASCSQFCLCANRIWIWWTCWQMLQRLVNGPFRDYRVMNCQSRTVSSSPRLLDIHFLLTLRWDIDYYFPEHERCPPQWSCWWEVNFRSFCFSVITRPITKLSNFVCHGNLNSYLCVSLLSICFLWLRSSEFALLMRSALEKHKSLAAKDGCYRFQRGTTCSWKKIAQVF